MSATDDDAKSAMCGALISMYLVNGPSSIDDFIRELSPDAMESWHDAVQILNTIAMHDIPEDVKEVCMMIVFKFPNVLMESSNSTMTALMLAANAGNRGDVERELRNNPEEQVMAASTSYGITALMYAARRGHASCVELLLRHKADEQVEAASNLTGYTALVWAATEGHAPCIKLLLRHRPAAQKLDMALGKLAARYAAAEGSSSEALRDCIEHLLALGAVPLDPDMYKTLWPIIRDCVQRARVPHLINEAIIAGLSAARM